VSGSKDVWGNDLVYFPDPKLTVSGSICDVSSSDTVLDTCDDSSCITTSNTAGNAAFLVLSNGPNLNLQTDTVTSSTIRSYLIDLPGIDDYATGLNRPQPYDDISKWVVLPELRSRLDCGGTPLRILDYHLPSGILKQTYSASVYATGGDSWSDGDASVGDADEAPDYEWCVTAEPPHGLSFECNGSLASSSDCDNTGTWQRCTDFSISGTPVSGGFYKIPVYVRDDSDNIDEGIFGLSISQIYGLNICPAYRIWSGFTASTKDYLIDGNCHEIDPLDEISVDGSRELNSGENIELHTTSGGACGGYLGALSYNLAILGDANGDCCIDFMKVPGMDSYIAVDRDCP
jgi:hypothetical protein